MLKLKPIFHSSAFHSIKSGEQTSFWHDAWAGQPLSLSKSGPIRRREISVQHAMNIFHSLIPGPFTVQQNLAYEKMQALVFTSDSNTITWRLSSSGNFTVKPIYKVLSQGGKTISRSCSLWRAKIMPSVALFFFFLIHNRLLTQDVMLKKNLSHASSRCVMCMHCPLKDAMHLFFLCPFASDMWNALSNEFGYIVLHVQESPLLTFLASTPGAKDHHNSWIVTFITAASLIWRESNNRVFRNRSTPHPILLARIMHDIALSLSHC